MCVCVCVCLFSSCLFHWHTFRGDVLSKISLPGILPSSGIACFLSFFCCYIVLQLFSSGLRSLHHHFNINLSFWFRLWLLDNKVNRFLHALRPVSYFHNSRTVVLKLSVINEVCSQTAICTNVNITFVDLACKWPTRFDVGQSSLRGFWIAQWHVQND